MTGHPTEPVVASTKLKTIFGDFDFACFSWGQHEEDNVLCASRAWADSPPLVRVQSACYTAEIFRSTDCDCHEQLVHSLQSIQEHGGVLLYMLCDGRGAGLLTKLRGLELGRTKGLDTAEAYEALGVDPDPRTYARAAYALKYMGATSVRLMTNNPRKTEGLTRHGIEVHRVPLQIAATADSRSYLETKRLKMGHLLQPSLGNDPDDG